MAHTTTTPATPAKRFAVEESAERLDRYKKVHVEGCARLKDPEPVGSASTLRELLEVLDGYAVTDENLVPGSEEELRDLQMMLAPCAAVLLNTDHDKKG